MLRVRLVVADEARALLGDPAFRLSWERLPCEAGSGRWFQRPHFCLAWYDAYPSIEPVLAIGEDDGRVRGVMALAATRSGLVHAGAHQCEYQGWLAEPEVDAEFGREAVARVVDRYRPGRWEWRNAAYGLPADFFEGPGIPSFHVETFESPVLDVHDEEFIAARLRGRLRGYRNRLVRRGLRYERVDDRERIARLLDTLALWCDLRQGAANAVFPFAGDPGKLRFHARLLADPRQVWMSVLLADERPLAIHVGAFDGRELAMGVQGHDPAESRLSPGALLLFEMAADLATHGARTLDLTPGGDAYKERYASGSRTLHRLVLFGSRTTALAEAAGRRVRQGARAAVSAVGADPSALRRVAGPAPPPEAAVFELDGADLPAREATTTVREIEGVLQAVHAWAVARGPEQAGPFLDEMSRRLGSGWIPIWVPSPEDAPTMAWLAPDDAGVDLSDPAAPRLVRDGSLAADPSCPVVLVDGRGGPVTDGGLLPVLATVLPSRPERLRVVTDGRDPAERGARLRAAV